MVRRSLEVQEQFIERVKSAFASLGLTQQVFAEGRLQLSRSTVSRFLRGKSINRENFMRICHILKLDWQEVTGLNEVTNPGLDNNQINQSSDNSNREANLKQGNYNENIHGNYIVNNFAGDYIQSTKATPQSPVSSSNLSIDIKTLVSQLRQQVKTDIKTRCGMMRILDMSQPIGLEDIYTKVNILEKISGHARKNISKLIANRDLINFNRFNFGEVNEKISGKAAVEKYRTLLILGKPGAGKTTFLKHVVIQCIKGLFKEELVPFFVTFKSFAEAENKPGLLTYLGSYLEQQQQLDFLTVLKQGKALICLDGLDEVLEQDSRRVISEIETLAQNYPHNQYLMTCRIAAKEYTFSQFTEVEIADFDWEQITIFSRNWFKTKAIKPETFLSRLEQDKAIQELASSPLLLTLLCLAFEESGDFPGNRAGLYKEGLDALLKKWDAKRGIRRDQVYQKLWSERKEDLLSKIAWDTFKSGEYFFKQDQVERYIGAYIRNLPGANTDEEALQLDSEIVLKSLESQHGLLVERAKQIYSFSHLSFHEYFTAREIIKVRQATDQALEELVSHLFEKRWREVFLLAVAMLPNAERLVLLIKHKIDTLVSNDEKIQRFLIWLQDISKVDHLSFLSIDSDILENIFDFYCKNFFSISRIFHFFFNHKFILYFVAQDSKQVQLYVDLYLILRITTVNTDPYDFLTGEMNLYIMLESCIKKSKLINLKFSIDLNNLRKRLPARVVTDKEYYRKWWQENGQTWSNDYRHAIIKHQNIGHDWQFSNQQKALLEQYYLANQLLTQCLHQDCVISPEVRQEIEATILLPIAEITKGQSNSNLLTLD